MDADLTWYCFRTTPKREREAERVLQRAGYPAYVPTEERPIRRRTARAKPKLLRERRPEVRIYPAMVGYCLVGFHGPVNWREMLTNWSEPADWFVQGRRCQVSISRGYGHLLKSVVGFDGFPAPIADEAVEELRGRLDGHSLPYRSAYSSRRSTQEGEHVRIESGPFAGFEGVVEEISAEGLAAIPVRLFNREVYRHEPIANLVAA